MNRPSTFSRRGEQLQEPVFSTGNEINPSIHKGHKVVIHTNGSRATIPYKGLSTSSKKKVELKQQQHV